MRQAETRIDKSGATVIERWDAPACTTPQSIAAARARTEAVIASILRKVQEKGGNPDAVQ